jgi:hypothetical protein
LSKTEQTPKGALALSFVQEGTLLLKGHSLFFRYRFASVLTLLTGKPKTSAKGFFISFTHLLHKIIELFYCSRLQIDLQGAFSENF